MKKRSVSRKTVNQNTDNSVSWFDNDNARLILLCAVFGFVGAHKFAQRKFFQGICFILLDLTVVGIIVSMIWALCDLVSLTIQKTNKAGNIIFGSVLLMGSLVSVPFVTGGLVFDDYSKPKHVAVNHDKVFLQEDLLCAGTQGNNFDASMALYANKAIVSVGTKVFDLKITSADFEKVKIYKGFYDADLPDGGAGHIISSSNPASVTKTSSSDILFERASAS